MCADIEGAPKPPWTHRPDGLLVSVRLTPQAAQDALDGVRTLADGTPVLQARVRAVPENGRANDALRRLIAHALDVAPSRVSLHAGGRGRCKSLRIQGDPESLSSRLERLVAAKD